MQTTCLDLAKEFSLFSLYYIVILKSLQENCFLSRGETSFQNFTFDTILITFLQGDMGYFTQSLINYSKGAISNRHSFT